MSGERERNVNLTSAGFFRALFACIYFLCVVVNKIQYNISRPNVMFSLFVLAKTCYKLCIILFQSLLSFIGKHSNKVGYYGTRVIIFLCALQILQDSAM